MDSKINSANEDLCYQLMSRRINPDCCGRPCFIVQSEIER